MHTKNKVKQTAFLGVFLALALICSYVEVLIPIDFGIPGVKLGLTNIVVVLMLYAIGAREAFFISMMRILLAGLLFGNMISILYSLSGGVLSFLVMLALKKTDRFGVLSVSAVGGVCHNIGQLIVAALVVANLAVWYYLPVLLFSGVLTGVLIGILSQELLVRLRFLTDRKKGE